MILHKISVFFYWIWIVMVFQQKFVSWINYSCNVHLTKKLKVYLNAYRRARFLMLQNFHISMFQISHTFVVQEWYPPTTAVHLQTQP